MLDLSRCRNLFEFGQALEECIGPALQPLERARSGHVALIPGWHASLAIRPASCELATPALSTLEWASTRQRVYLAPEALAKIGRIVCNPPKPSGRLRASAKRQGWSKP
jgi:hypothetical protein